LAGGLATLATLRSGPTGRPGVVLLAAEAATALAAEAATRTAALGLGDLGAGVAQRRSDPVDVELDDGALLALLGVVRARLQPARRDHPRATVERLGDVLGRVTPDRAAHEEGLPVLPLVGLPVERARRGGHGEVRD